MRFPVYIRVLFLCSVLLMLPVQTGHVHNIQWSLCVIQCKKPMASGPTNNTTHPVCLPTFSVHFSLTYIGTRPRVLGYILTTRNSHFRTDLRTDNANDTIGTMGFVLESF